MDALLLQAVLPEIRDALIGRHVTKVESVGKYGVLVRFGGSRRNLYLSAHPELSRVGLCEEPPAGGAPRAAPDNLSEPLVGAVLVGIEQERGGRVVRLRFDAEAGRHRHPRLVGELIPRFANLVLVGNDERILSTKRDFTGPNRPRQVVAGQVYIEPAAEGKPGVKAGRVVAAAGATGDGHGAGSTPSPRLARHVEDGRLKLFPVDPGDSGLDAGWEFLPPDNPHATIAAWFAHREEAEAAETLLVDLRRLLVKRRGRAAKALRQIEARLGEADREPEFRGRAELLAAHPGRVKRGMKSIVLPAFDGSGDVEIELDPKKDGQGNVDAQFKKARRLGRGREELETQRAIQAADLADADHGLEAIDPPPPSDVLRELAARYAPGILEGVVPGRRRGGRGGGQPAPARRSPAPEKERHPSLPEGFFPRVYDLPGGWVVWVGRNAKQNDELTHRRSSQKDLWFHARGAQGSHTVLRIGSGKGEPPKAIVEAAAAIAAWFSKARNSSLVPVAYTEKRYVRRPRKAPVGTALMMREKVLMVRPELPGA